MLVYGIHFITTDIFKVLEVITYLPAEQRMTPFPDEQIKIVHCDYHEINKTQKVQATTTCTTDRCKANKYC